MKILALETSAKSASAAVVENGTVLASAYQCSGLTHSRTLMPMVEETPTASLPVTEDGMERRISGMCRIWQKAIL